MPLPKNHPALGAFKRRYKPDWEAIADELAHGLRRRVNFEEKCPCQDCLSLRVYDEAKWRTRYG